MVGSKEEAERQKAEHEGILLVNQLFHVKIMVIISKLSVLVKTQKTVHEKE